MPDWERLKKNTLELEPKVNEIVKQWFKENPDWTGWVAFQDYPPRFMGKFEIIHINQLSDKRKEELGILTTKLCKECGLLGKLFWNSEKGKNRLDYKFWLPIK